MHLGPGRRYMADELGSSLQAHALVHQHLEIARSHLRSQSFVDAPDPVRKSRVEIGCGRGHTRERFEPWQRRDDELASGRAGDAEDRKSVASGQSLSVRVDHGGCRIITKKT